MERLIVGGACGYRGEAPHAAAQLLAHPGLQVLIDAAEAPASVALEGAPARFASPSPPAPEAAPPPHPAPSATGEAEAGRPLDALAWARSGDKADAANVGIVPRRPEYLPWIRAAIPMAKGRIERFHLPGLPAMNLLLHEALGGGGIASLRDDAQGKGYAQRLLAPPARFPGELAP